MCELQELVTFVKSYIVPEGYPDSVAPAYTPYMQWRAVQVCNSQGFSLSHMDVNNGSRVPALKFPD